MASIKSCSNWRLLIDTLEGWNVLLPEVATEFRKLSKLRNRSLHFNEKSVNSDRDYALHALASMSLIVAKQFGVIGDMPWFIPNTPGASYIAQSWESNPFVQLVYLPNSLLLGYKHKVVEVNPHTGEWRFDDSFEYEERNVSDEEFVTLLLEQTSGKSSVEL